MWQPSLIDTFMYIFILTITIFKHIDLSIFNYFWLEFEGTVSFYLVNFLILAICGPVQNDLPSAHAHIFCRFHANKFRKLVNYHMESPKLVNCLDFSYIVWFSAILVIRWLGIFQWKLAIWNTHICILFIRLPLLNFSSYTTYIKLHRD